MFILKNISVNLCMISLLLVNLLVGCKPKSTDSPSVTESSPAVNTVTTALAQPTEVASDGSSESEDALPTADALTREAEPQVTPPAPISVPSAKPTKPQVVLPTPKPVRQLRLNSRTSSSYERFITRWRSINGATLNLEINDPSGSGRLWFVGVQAVKPHQPVRIDPRHYGAGSNNLLFNWLRKTIVVENVLVKTQYYRLDNPVSLLDPLRSKHDLFPHDPAIRYNGNNIEIMYHHLLHNTANVNDAQPLYASTWLGFSAGDEVDLVIYLYLVKRNYWSHKRMIYPVLDQGFNESLRSMQLDHVIELQRFPVTLK